MNDVGRLIPGHSFAYQYDGIGNRTAATHGGANTAVTYTPNALNQYDPIETEGGRFILGEAPPADPVIINGNTANPSARPGGLGFYWKQITADNSSGPLWSTDTVESGGVTITGQAWIPAANVTPEYDLDGNLTNDGRWDYLWDAENRLIRMTTTPSAANDAGVPRLRLDFVYDCQGRRVSKTVSTSPDGANWTLATDRRFLYDGWNLIAEYEGSECVPPALTATYLWGLDLSGTPQGAGGVGGLLAVRLLSSVSESSVYPAYDGNGNISAWIGASGTLLARMDYSPFGQLIAHYKFTTDAILARLPFGFSTKYTDPETGLLYYGHRYYDPVTGRWPSRDPIEEEGGLNLYGFVENSGPGKVDTLGRQVWAKLSSNHKYGKGLRYQIDEYFRYKICACSKENPHLEILSTEDIEQGKRSVEEQLGKFATPATTYTFFGKMFMGTLKIWPKYIGTPDGRCAKEQTENTLAATEPYYNVIYVHPYVGAGKGVANGGGGDFGTIAHIALGHNQRTLGHELGHMIGYEHPHGYEYGTNSDQTIAEFKDDIMVQTGNDPKTGTGTMSHPFYMHSVYRHLETAATVTSHGMLLFRGSVIMKTEVPM